jgi:Asp-tRNA(Asn)/Glu-tRNA(Gln) amidotransferase A subunit family amidase
VTVTATRDVADRVRLLLDGDRTVAGGGPWVRLRPEALDEAVAGGRPGGPLDGVLVGIKDLVAVGGLPIGAGSRTRAGAPDEPRDAAVVARLREAGGVVAGTVALHELAFGVTGVNDQVGFPPHPDDPARIPGGSSSGSAVAVASYDCGLAIGTDTGGSIRIPAALCGVVGFKPARGRYPLDGVLPLAPSLDHVGLLGRTPETVVTAHQVLTGDTVVPQRPRRIGVDRDGLDAASDPVASAVDAVLRALADAGTELVELHWPDAGTVVDVSTTILVAEAARTHHDLLASPERELLDPRIADRLASGAAVGEDALAAARAEAERIDAEVRSVLDTVDVVAGPTVPILAPTIEEARADASLPRTLVACTRVANITGVPAVSLPIGGADLPVGLQLLAATDERALAHAVGVARTLGPRSP